MSNPWYLVADIGGTNARFSALGEGELESSRQFFYSVQDYPAFDQVIARVLEDVAAATGWSQGPRGVCLAVACPAHTDVISFTNSHWSFSPAEVQKQCGSEQIYVINDFEAVAHGITELNEHDCRQIGGKQPQPGKPAGILGAGTGLGVAGLVYHQSGYSVLATEGGHVDFAPVGARQIELLQTLLKSFSRVSAERLVSGQGLQNIYRGLSVMEGCEPQLETPAQISGAALDESDALAVEALQLFCQICGAVAGNLALTLGATGGIYIAGGIIPRFADYFASSEFRAFFDDKGRFRDYMAPIPVYLVIRDNLGLLGAATKLHNELNAK